METSHDSTLLTLSQHRWGSSWGALVADVDSAGWGYFGRPRLLVSDAGWGVLVSDGNNDTCWRLFLIFRLERAFA